MPRTGLERVTVEGLGNRARATLIVSRGDADELVRIDRQGEATVIIPAARLISARRERGMVGKFVGANRLVVLQWRAENGDIYETGFLPRYKADVDRVESALWWHTGETTDGPADDDSDEPTEPTDDRPTTRPTDPEPTDPQPKADTMSRRHRAGRTSRHRRKDDIMSAAAGFDLDRAPAVLVLEDGRTFRGDAYGATGQTVGEAVFSTGMTGYQETLTDPSYHRQVVVMTAPHVGNTGVNDEDDESAPDLGGRLRRARPRPAPVQLALAAPARGRPRRPGRRRHQRHRHPRPDPPPARAGGDAGRHLLGERADRSGRPSWSTRSSRPR